MQGNNGYDPKNMQPEDDGFSDFFEGPQEIQPQASVENQAQQEDWGQEPQAQEDWGEQPQTDWSQEPQADWGSQQDSLQSEYQEPAQEMQPIVLDKKTAKEQARQEKLNKKAQAKLDKKSKGSKNPKGKDTQAEEEQQTQDMILYIVMDKSIPGLINFFRECGVKVSNIFDDIVDAKNTVLMQSEPIRIVVVDTGLGKFTTTSMRSELIDMLGIADENSKTTVFYTDSALKVDTIRTLGKSGKKIDWIQYKSTAVVAATILSYNENYIYDMEDDLDVIETSKSALNFKGLTMSDLQVVPRHNITGLTGAAIMRNMVEDTGEGLPGFDIRY